MAIAQRRIRRKRPMAPPSPWGGNTIGGFQGIGQPPMAATGGGYGPMVQPGGPPDQFGGAMGAPAAQFNPGQGGQFGPPPGGGLLGNMMGGGMVQPGFMTGGPDDPAMGGSGYNTQGPGMGQPPTMIPPGAPPMGQPGGQIGAPDMGQPGMPGGGMQPQPTPYDPGVSAGRLAEAQRLAGMGQMGRAKQQWELGGGAWGGDAHRFLRG